MKNVIENFKTISQIPRESSKEEKIRDFLIDWSKKNNLEYKTDEIWNLIVYVKATKGYENKETLILQWHLDMVCVKDKDSNHNFETDSIEIYEDSWFLKAKWTTLWADNWIAIAYMMSSIELENHPALELLFTIDEETWLTWASNLDASLLKWKKIINIDTEECWEICISSAWWARIQVNNNFETINTQLETFKIEISGLKWWHSWVDIDKSKWNAVIAFCNFLYELDTDIELVSINSWTALNVIPSNLEAVVWIKETSNLQEKIDIFIKDYSQNYDEPNLKINISQSSNNKKTLTSIDSKHLLRSILMSWSWVIKYSETISWHITTSHNLWIINLLDWKINIWYFPRSSNFIEIEENLEQKKEFFDWFEIICDSIYWWWEEKPTNELVQITKKAYDEVLWYEAKITTIHAGLECWILCSKIWIDAHAVSIWPNIFWAHWVNERCEIKTIEIVWDVIEKILKNI